MPHSAIDLPTILAGDEPAASALPASVAACVWHGDELGTRPAAVVASGFRPLDKELPGGGWPCQALTELLLEPGVHVEWRLLSPSLRRVQKRGLTIFLIGTPQTPHLPGLRLMGLDERRLVWIRADTARERLWATQQVIQSGQAGAILSWLPQADARSLRRLQACAQSCEAPVFIMRPAAVRHETSPAPLRLDVAPGSDACSLRLHILKRRGPQLEKAVDLPSVPGGLAQVLARRAASSRPSRLSGHQQAPITISSTSPPPTPTSTPTPIPRPVSVRQIPEEPIDELLAGAVLPTFLRAIAG